MKTGHGGNLREASCVASCEKGEWLDFSANLNPLGPPNGWRQALHSSISQIRHYPEPDALRFRTAISQHFQIPLNEVLAGNGSTELLYLLPQVFSPKRVVIPVPCYLDYLRVAEIARWPVVKWTLNALQNFELNVPAFGNSLRDGDLVILGRPNNPTGRVPSANAIRQLAQSMPRVIFVVDESFADFLDSGDRLLIQRPSNVCVLWSFTKIYAIPGLRLGVLVADSKIICELDRVQPPWSVNSLASEVGINALKDEFYFERTRALVNQQRQRLIAELGGMSGLKAYPSSANFLLFEMEHAGWTAERLANSLLKKGIAIRVCNNFEGLDSRYFRIAIRTESENTRLISAMREVMGFPAIKIKPTRKPALMLQGTSSDAGKSVLASAFCRILLQDGYRVAPFKAQNMALNSFVTRDGGEMGRAQVVQAQACRLEPDVRMNPVLLKPNTDTGAQVIVHGKPISNMEVQEYVSAKTGLWREVTKSYDSLSEDFDVMVLEGAGSPGEMNLKQHDIVNMRMAQYAQAQVLIVGDIDRGGVFASLIGTMETFEDWERDLVLGFMVNKFRGNESLLNDAFDYVKQYTGKPVLGTIPYLPEMGLPEEDSLAWFQSRNNASKQRNDWVEVAVIVLPHTSNFTDFDAIRMEPDVCMTVVHSLAELKNPSAVIIPGSKNVIGDMAYLQKSGLADKLCELAHAGQTELVGICGGLQILGREIKDPHRLESSDGRTIAGLNLLELSTVLESEKVLARVNARHQASGFEVSGYEIHHGQTSTCGLDPATIRSDGRVIGWSKGDGKLWGSYLHGIFDHDDFRRWWINGLRVRKKLEKLNQIQFRYDVDPLIERLADLVRSKTDMRQIYRKLFSEVV